MGTPKYKEWIAPDGLLRLTGYARDGLTDQEIAQKIGVSRKTFGEWKAKYGCIRDTLKDARAPVIVEIENSFFSRCRWKTVTETETETLETAAGKKYTKTIVRERHYPPDTACLLFALKNGLPHRYSDKPQARGTDIEKQHTDIVAAIKAIATDGD